MCRKNYFKKNYVNEIETQSVVKEEYQLNIFNMSSQNKTGSIWHEYVKMNGLLAKVRIDTGAGIER